MRRGIAGIAGSRIEAVRCPECRFRPLSIAPPVDELCRRAAGAVVAAVGRVGKRVVIELTSGEKIVIEPRMTGRVQTAAPPDREHLRMVFELSGGPIPRVYFWDSRGLGVVRLLTPDEFAVELGRKRIGPDALEITAEDLRRRLASSRRPIKVALLDQRAVAGVGNLYASEILHRARVHPAAPCDRLRRADWQRVHRAMREILAEAIRCQGSTLSDGMYKTAVDQPGEYQERHLVYQRAGERCLQCGRATIVRMVQAQRSTFLCPRCQRVRP